MEADWIVRRLAEGNDPILEIGCGIGALFPRFGSRWVVGVDFKAEGLALTRKHHPGVPLSCATADKLPFHDATFSVILLQHVLEHLPDPSGAAAEWFRVLRPEGTLLVLTPNRAFCEPSIFDDPTHVHLFDGPGLEKLMAGSGFTITDLRTLGLPWFRSYSRIPGGWRLRRAVTRWARGLSSPPLWRWKGQTLCCAARRVG